MFGNRLFDEFLQHELYFASQGLRPLTPATTAYTIFEFSGLFIDFPTNAVKLLLNGAILSTFSFFDR